MTTTFVFLGAFSETPDLRLSRFGQRVELPPDLAEETKHPRGLPCIPAEDFDALGFTAEELRKYGVVDTHARATDEFLAKKSAALEVLHKIRGGE